MRDVRDVAIRGAEPAEEIQVAAHDAEDVGFVVPGNEHRLSAGHGPERAQTDDLPLERRRGPTEPPASRQHLDTCSPQ